MYIVHCTYVYQTIMHRQDNFIIRIDRSGYFLHVCCCCLLILRRIFFLFLLRLKSRRGDERARVGVLLTSYRVVMMMVEDEEEGLMQSPLFVLTCTLLRVPACTCTVRDASF